MIALKSMIIDSNPWAGMPTEFKVIGWIIFRGAIDYVLSK